MSLHIFALRTEPQWLVATEASDETAAALLDAGESIFLGTLHDLGRLAMGLDLPLITIAQPQDRQTPDPGRANGHNMPRSSAGAAAKVA